MELLSNLDFLLFCT